VCGRPLPKARREWDPLVGPVQSPPPLIGQRTVPHAGVGTSVLMATVAVSVLTWLVPSYIVWFIRTGDGEHVKW